ncbi:nitrate reductase [Agromyces protaetiae]|uniref:Nitrate reductase n=1 Tax=Agromyces protaetiae TaxID=2509455 RepID=A0A4P6FEZ6_9MICO|nr:cytosine permease [Agromyces protaetiae]QAY72959.1 nitrate reductase [Agromyces protaetiae]
MSNDAEATLAPTTDRAGHVEQHGIDFVPDAERHGRPRELFWVWMSANVIYLYFVLGGVLMLLGLSVQEAIVITIVGNVWWLAVGWLSVSGPASGTPSVTVMRAMFGIRGNRVFGGGLGVAIGLFYEIINIAVATLAANAMLALLGIELEMWAEWIVLGVVAVLSFVLSVYGHATILKLAPWFSAALAAAFAVAAVFIFGAADFSYTPAPMETGEHWAAILLGYAIIAAGPLSWGTGADYSRYLPRSTPKRGVIWWSALGGFIPSVVLGGLGIVAATSIDMTDPQTAIAEIVPSWFTPIFLGIVVLGSITNNVLVAYSTGLYAQGLGVKLSRATTVVVTGVLATAAAWWFVFIAPSFLDTLNASLELSVTVLGPLVAVYAVDIFLRRNRYDGVALNDERPGSPFWYSGGWYWPGIVAMVVGTTLAVLMANTTLYVGPIAQALGGADLSALLAPVIGGAIYAVLWLTTNPYRDRMLRPDAVNGQTRREGESGASAAPDLEADPGASAPLESEVLA